MSVTAGKYGLPVPNANGARPPAAPAPSEVRPTVSLRALQEAQAVEAPRNDAALAQLRGEVPPATPIAPYPPPQAAAPPPPPPPPETTADIIGRLRGRRAQIVAEVLRLEGLKAELKLIDGMIAATEASDAT